VSDLKLNRSQFTGEVDFFYKLFMKHSKSSWKHWRNKAKTVWKTQVTTSGQKESMPLSQSHPYLISLLRNNVHAKS